MAKRHSFLFRRVVQKEPPMKPISEMTPEEVDREIRLRVAARQQVGLIPVLVEARDTALTACGSSQVAAPKIVVSTKKKSYITKIPHVSRKSR